MDKMEPIEKEDKIEKTDDTCGNVYDPKCGKNKTKLELIESLSKNLSE